MIAEECDAQEDGKEEMKSVEQNEERKERRNVEQSTMMSMLTNFSSFSFVSFILLQFILLLSFLPLPMFCCCSCSYLSSTLFNSHIYFYGFVLSTACQNDSLLDDKVVLVGNSNFCQRVQVLHSLRNIETKNIKRGKIDFLIINLE